tara:strand:- start:29 stop:919 length:891 start_codon:yes stop_codon:yes gene_type:complete
MEQDNQLSEPIFIIGPSRSGTTWLKCMLAVNDNLFTVPETKFYQYVLSSSKNPSNKDLYPTQYTLNPKYITPSQLEVSLHHLKKLSFIDDDHHKIIKLLQEKAINNQLHRRDFFIEIINHIKILNKISGKTLVEGTPRHVISHEDIITDFPDARFIIMYRDSIDLAISAKETYGFPFFESLRDSFALKNQCDEFYEKHSDRVIATVNYDFLEKKTGKVVNEIFDILGLEAITEHKLIAESKKIFKELHKSYYINTNQPRMEGKKIEKVFPSYLKSSLSYLTYHIKNILRYLLRKII